MRRAVFILILSGLYSISSGQSARLDSIRTSMGQMNYQKALAILNSPVPGDSADKITELYLRAEIYLVLGNEKFNTSLDSLTQLGAKYYCDILKLKHAIFIGSSEADSLLDNYLAIYPCDPELNYCRWLLEVDRGSLPLCRKQAADISISSLLSFGPWMALYYNAWSNYEYGNALHYMDSLETVSGPVYISRNRRILELMKEIDIATSLDDFIELPYASCGPGMGMIIRDGNNNKIKLELDTGTSYGFMTLHDTVSGNKLSGSDTLIIDDGIWYNYMTAAEDLHFKISDLKDPFYKNVLIGYFNGDLHSADGCISPSFFRHHAIHIDPINLKVFLRSREKLDEYKNLHREDITVVKYINRNGWIFIPCTVNGKEVLMMVETGSRDVNFNKLSTDYLGLDIYTDFVKWRGKDYPVKKTDCTISIGDKITYDVKGGLISDFVIGNLRYGQASAGDLGPDFFKNFSFIIDPFKREIIFENPTKQPNSDKQ